MLLSTRVRLRSENLKSTGKSVCRTAREESLHENVGMMGNFGQYLENQIEIHFTIAALHLQKSDMLENRSPVLKVLKSHIGTGSHSLNGFVGSNIANGNFRAHLVLN